MYWDLKSFTKVEDHVSSPNFLISFRKREYLDGRETKSNNVENVGEPA